MIAKVAVHAPTRAEAIARGRDALRRTVLLGTVTNTAFLERVLGHPAFGAGETHTGFLADHADELAARAPDADAERCLVAAAALASPRFDARLSVPEPLASMGAWKTGA
jgi:acetyl/propionyl-CoA carboxylase alpha subunit